MDDIALLILGIIEEKKPTTRKELIEKTRNDKNGSKVNIDNLDLRPYFFKELDKEGITYVDKTIINAKGKEERVVGYFKNNKKII